MAFDATGLSTLLVKKFNRRAAASDATGLSTLLAYSQFFADAPNDVMPNGTTMGLHAWSEPKPNVVYYNYPLYSPPPLFDTVVTGVDRALPHISMPTSYSDTVSLGVDRAHVHGSMSLHNSDTDVLGVDRL